MNPSLLLAVAILGSVVSSSIGVPVISRRQADADQPLCPESRAVVREEYSNTDNESVCFGQCRLPRLAFAGIPFGEIVVVDSYDCCNGYTREDSQVQGFNFTCVSTPTTSTSSPDSSTATDSATTSTPSVVTLLPVSVGVPLCPLGRSVAQGEYVSLVGVCPVRCQYQVFFFIYQLNLDVTSYECCQDYTRIVEGDQFRCILTESVTANPASTEPAVEEVVTESTSTPGASTASTEPAEEEVATESTSAPTEVVTEEPTVPRCTSDDRDLSTYVNVEPNSLCEVECFTQMSFAGAPFGPKNVQTRYQCCDGYVAQRAYPNSYTNFDYECVQ